MKTRRILALFLFCAMLCESEAQNQTPARSPADDARIARLGGLAKVWGAIKYFHPYLAYRDIDWDKALRETIPRVNATKTPQEYQTAVNQMLATLNDKSTRAEIEGETKADTTPATAEATPIRTEDRVS
jgi:hypothetical protein